MADPRRRLPQNVAGAFFVDASCIDCDACRQIAPETFQDHGDQSSVYCQPQTRDDERRALMALVACPTGSIGTDLRRYDARTGVAEFPQLLVDNVYFCGFTAKESFGAWSYLIVRPEAEGGNILVDSPRFAAPLVKQIASLGGVRRMFLTHVDDVAAHQEFARRFGCERMMHAADGARRLALERIIEGDDAVALDPQLLAIPVPGHTRGHAVLLYRDKFLFTGDHLAWSPTRKTLTAFRHTCWYSWTEQIRSMRKLFDYRFEWVLPGHGRIHRDSANKMQQHVHQCVEWMESVSGREV